MKYFIFHIFFIIILNLYIRKCSAIDITNDINNKTNKLSDKNNNGLSDEKINIQRMEGDYTEDHVNNDYGNDSPYPNTFNYRRHNTKQYDNLEYTREVMIKQGRLKGIRRMHHRQDLITVEQFLGLPYAEAPVYSKRFMPPGAPPQWNGILFATKLRPVCPQNLPVLDNSNNRFSNGRFEQLKRILPFLKDESEDCLYLNLYVPSLESLRVQAKFPVIIYIHGESYEWNSGNAYDGSVLASYGHVIVVTINYRLGVLGFMQPDINGNSVANFGLLDQIAALQWVKENIASFGGDSRSVTIMGHGTGAACVNLLMISPVARGLFHRAILMSGSALSDWATSMQTGATTMSIANNLDCPAIDDAMSDCLRQKSYPDILRAKPKVPQYSTPFGPVVGNTVLPTTPHNRMGQDHDTFGLYDLLFGVTEIESYHILNKIGLVNGLLENERNDNLRFYMQNRFEVRPDLALAYTLHEYTDSYVDPNKAAAEEHRDTFLEILSDARVVAPLVQTGVYHSKINPRNFMYVFGHNSHYGEYGHIKQSIVGEELPYVFGAPLGGVGPFPVHYTDKEILLSEAIMKYWTNFAKTGNPKAPWKDQFLTLGPRDWAQYDIDWPEFNGINESYLNLGIPPVVAYQYRKRYMKFWNNDLPDRLNSELLKRPLSPYPSILSITEPPLGHQSNSYSYGSINLVPTYGGYRTTENPFEIIKEIKTPNNYDHRLNPFSFSENDQQQHDFTTTVTSSSESTFYILIGIVVIFFILNLIILFGYLWKKGGLRKLKRNYDDNTNIDGTTDDDIKRSKLNETDDSFILDIVRKSGGNNTYEPVKTSYSPINGFKLIRQNSTSTVDPHTKVVDWIAQEITKYSPKIKKKFSFSSPTRFLSKPKKVSIGIDATPHGRSNSVLQQEPIEITKSKSFDNSLSSDVKFCQEIEIDNGSSCRSLSQSTQNENNVIPDFQINHKHSHSDPVEMYYNHRKNYKNEHENVTSFIEETKDINQTSRDDDEDQLQEVMTPEEALITIQRRNYPKVLPDFPDDDDVGAAIKRRSLPAHTFLQNTNSYSPTNIYKIPPAPPPRTTSTLGRRSSNRRRSNNITTSPLMLAEEPPDVEEPEITSNSLHVGPLIPKSDGIYSTIKKCTALSGTINQNFQTTVDALNGSPQMNDRKNNFLSKLKPPGKIEPKPIIKPNIVRQLSSESRQKSHIPRVQVAQETTKMTSFQRSPSNSSSNDTESSIETVKPNIK